MSLPQINQYFVKLENFLGQSGPTTNDLNNLERRLCYLEDHSSIIGTFLVLMASGLQQNVAERTLCVLLEGLFESLRELSAETLLQTEATARGDVTHTPQRGRPR